MILLLIKVSSIANTTDKWYFCTPALCSYNITVVWYYCTLRGPKDLLQMLLLCYFRDRGHALVGHLLQPGHRDPLPTLLQPALWVHCVQSVGKQQDWPRLWIIIVLILIMGDITSSISSHLTKSVVGGNRTSNVSTILSGTTLACRKEGKLSRYEELVVAASCWTQQDENQSR